MEPTVPEGLADGGLQALHVGLLLFGDDLTTIQTTLLPGMAVRALPWVVAVVCSCVRVSRLLRACSWHLAPAPHTNPHAHGQVEALEAFHTAVYAPSSARAHQQQLRAAGFQPGSLFSGNSRRRVLAKLPAGEDASGAATVQALLPGELTRMRAPLPAAAGAFGPSEFGDSMASLLTAYDACKLPLAGLVTGLVRRCGPAALVRAVYECLEGAGVDTVRPPA